MLLEIGGIQGIKKFLKMLTDKGLSDAKAADFFENCPEEKHCISYNDLNDTNGLCALEALEYFFFCKSSSRDVYSHYDTLGCITGVNISLDSCMYWKILLDKVMQDKATDYIPQEIKQKLLKDFDEEFTYLFENQDIF